MTGGYEVPMLIMGALVLIAGMLVPLARHAHVGVATPALARGTVEGV
jgi:hypothetical protein